MRMRAGLGLVGLLSLLGACSNLNFAAAVRWKGYVDTDLAFSSFFGNDHTVAFRFFPQYTMISEAPVVTINGAGSYTLGLGAYRTPTNAVKVLLRVGSTSATYSLGNPTADGKPIPLKGKWHTLAVAKSGTTFTLFLDEKHVAKDGGGDLQATATDIAAATGTLRIGRAGETQFYGLVDDLMVFDKALTQTQIATLFADKRITSSSVSGLGLVRAYTFDKTLPTGNALPAEFAFPVTLQGSAYNALVTQKRDETIDIDMLPPPNQEATMQLPFETNVSWQVEQGNEGLASHNDGAAFSWDFIRNDAPPAAALPTSATCGTPVLAVADGQITKGCDLGDPPTVGGTPDFTQGCASGQSQLTQDGPLIDGYDFANITDGSDEMETYLHLQKGSLTEMLPNNGGLFHSPVTSSAAPSLPISIGQKLARAGTRGMNNCHLHFSAEDLAGETYPVGFGSYEVFNTDLKEWVDAEGIPTFGQLIRRPKPKKAPPGGKKASSKAESAAACAVMKADLADAEAEHERLRGAEPTAASAKQTAAVIRRIDTIKRDGRACR